MGAGNVAPAALIRSAASAALGARKIPAAKRALNFIKISNFLRIILCES
jgi:hypothetical protein